MGVDMDDVTALPIPAPRAPGVETWLPVLGYEGCYEVSDLGRVKSLRRPGTRGVILKANPDSHGYLAVGLCDKTAGKGQRSGRVHVLVAEAFLGPRPSGLILRHLDGNQLNNVPSNLAWGTHSENSYDHVRHGRHWNAIKTHCKRGHEFTPENTYLSPKNMRTCRTCQAEYMRRRRAMAD